MVRELGDGEAHSAAMAGVAALRLRWEAKEKAKKQNVAQGALGGVLGLQLPSSGPTWPGRSGRRRRAAPRGGEGLLLVGLL